MTHFGNPTPSSNNAETQFYEQLFRSFDSQNFGTVQGGQVFGFFLSSGLTKAALGDIWDEATQKQSGGLSLAKFINAMKLIALAQRGIPPKLSNISQNAMIAMPSMQYPSHIAKPNQPQPSQSQQNQPQQKQAEVDPFGGLTSGLGFGDEDTLHSNKGPSAPSWNTADDITANTSKDIDATITDIDIIETTTTDIVDITITPSDITGTESHGNEYGPPSHIKQHAPTLTVDNIVPHQMQYQMDDITPGLNRRISSKILYQEERLREQIRQAEQREKLAKKQANTQRIENERLERENEQIKLQINAARQSQADALKQSQQALTSIQPLRVENEKLKQAINQWKELIQTKDEELEALEAEVDQLRLENEKLENVLRDDKSKVDDIQFKLERSDALLKDIKTKNKDYQIQINDLIKDKVVLEDDKRNLDLKIAQIKDEMKKLKRNQNSGLGLDRNTLKQKEADLFNINDISLNASPQKNQERAESDDDETGVVPPGTHDFNFSEDNQEEEEEDEHTDNEPDMIDHVITEEVEVEEDVISYVLFDEDYKSSPWYMSSSDITNYHKYFVQADTNKDGLIDGNEANKFFTKSKLNRKLLAKIWVLSDQKKQGKLTEPMFCAMFHLVMKIKKSGNKLNVPNELPQCLTVEVTDKLGSKIQKIVKQKKLITQKKTIKIDNPNKKGKSKVKTKVNRSENHFDNNNNWDNDFSFDTNTQDKEKEKEQQDAAKDDDDNWNAFGNFFDQ